MEGLWWYAGKARDLRRRPYGPNLVNTRLRRRAVLKNGEYNMIRPKFPNRYVRYMKDAFTGLVDSEWKWTFQFMVIGFLACWLTFALLWFLIAFVHKDLHEDHLPNRQSESGWTPCVLNIYGFPSCFLYSLETQHTTGYGLRAITEECPEAIFLMCAQCLIGSIIDSFTVGVIFAKLTRPLLTSFTVQFSKNGVICLRDGVLCLMFRIGDLRKSRIVGAGIKAILIENTTTKEGECLKNFETNLSLEYDEAGSDLFYLWPVTVYHKIDKDSPLYNLSATEMLRQNFEIVIILEGTVESTGQGMHALSSYLTDEILWGMKFQTMVRFNSNLQGYEVDYSLFDKTSRVMTPMLSAAELESLSNEEDDDDHGEAETLMKPSDVGDVDHISQNTISCSQMDTIFEDDEGERSGTPPFPVWV